MTDWVLDKPPGFYLSSFRCVSGFVAKEVARYEGPYPYIDGLILQVTQEVGAIEVHHAARTAGQSGYNLRRLVRLWTSTFVNFSIMPLRLATLLGLIMAVGGLGGLALVFYLRLTNQGPDYGWGTLMGALLVFSGTQLVMLGLIGEYIGRMFLTVSGRPQAIVRSVERGG
jgi:undecaprenyl-phosphate 4-deoxy-4-formamido-L-arabinose transferase